jgi:hypothetical protein
MDENGKDKAARAVEGIFARGGTNLCAGVVQGLFFFIFCIFHFFIYLFINLILFIIFYFIYVFIYVFIHLFICV